MLPTNEAESRGRNKLNNTKFIFKLMWYYNHKLKKIKMPNKFYTKISIWIINYKWNYITFWIKYTKYICRMKTQYLKKLIRHPRKQMKQHNAYLNTVLLINQNIFFVIWNHTLGHFAFWFSQETRNLIGTEEIKSERTNFRCSLTKRFNKLNLQNV